MSIRRIAGIVCLALAAVTVITGFDILSKGLGITDPSGLGVSRAVGVFVPTMALLIAGLILVQKPSGKVKT